MRRSKVSQALIIALVGGLGLAVALGLSLLCTQGKFLYAGMLVAGAAVVIGAICSLEVAMLALLMVCFTDGLAKGIAPGTVALLAKDALLLIGLLRWIWVGLTSPRWEAVRLPVILPAFLFILYCGVQMFNTETADLLVALAGFRSWVIWIGVYVIGYEYLTTRQHIERLLIVIMVLGLATGVYGIVQYNIGYGHLYALSPQFGSHERFTQGNVMRAASTLVHPGTFGEAMSLTAILCIGAVAFVRGKPWLKMPFVAAAAVCFVGMATSGARAPLLSLVVGGLSLLVLVRRPQLMFVAAVIGIGVLIVMNNFAGGAFEARYNPKMINYELVKGRVMGPWGAAENWALKHPLGTGVASGTGVGRGIGFLPGQRIRLNPASYGMIENEYGRALRELGFPGMILFLWLLYTAVKGCLGAYLQVRTFAARSLTAACIAVAISTLARLAVGSSLYLVPSGPLFWLVCALAVRVPHVEAQEMIATRWPASAAASDERRLVGQEQT